jgi:hypothetical protein
MRQQAELLSRDLETRQYENKHTDIAHDADSLRALSAVAESLHKGLGAVEAALMSNDQGRAIILLEAPDVDEKGGA